MADVNSGDDKQVVKIAEQKRREIYPIADVVSLETVVNLLIRKGLLTTEELYEEEEHLRQDLARIKQTPAVGIKRNGQANSNGGWLKRQMSKRRWTRRLGALLFGWKWRKIKVNHDTETIQNLK